MSSEYAPAKQSIRIGLTEDHGMAMELLESAPDGCQLSFVDPRPVGFRFIRSPIKGYFDYFESPAHDLLEAVISPIHTKQRWIYSLACFQEAIAFNILGAPLPRRIRSEYLRRLMRMSNFKRLIFWSEAGRRTLESYAGLTDPLILKKTEVVYPAIRAIPEAGVPRTEADNTLLLFSGDFFRKGGVNVVDAFEAIQSRYPGITLQLCCDENIDFNTSDQHLRSTYLAKIRQNRSIIFGRVSRQKMLTEILPRTTVYLLPTYAEAFGFAILEAQAHGIPVIATNHFAIPEMIQDGVNGLLIDTSTYDQEAMFRGYVVNHIPTDFRTHVTSCLVQNLTALLGSQELRARIGKSSLETVRKKFSFELRNEKMKRIYEEAVAPD